MHDHLDSQHWHCVHGAPRETYLAPCATGPIDPELELMDQVKEERVCGSHGETNSPHSCDGMSDIAWSPSPPPAETYAEPGKAGSGTAWDMPPYLPVTVEH